MPRVFSSSDIELFKMSTTEIINKPIALKLRVLHITRLAIASIVRFFCRLYYGNEGEKIPPITDEILKLPAIEVAKKIRNKEVCITFLIIAFFTLLLQTNTFRKNW